MTRLVVPMASDLEKVGIKTKITVLERGAYLQARTKGDIMTCITGVVGPPDPDSPLVTLYATKSFPPGLNTARYDQVDDMLASAAAEQDEAARNGIYRDILAKTMEDVPVLPLYADRLFLAHGNHVKGLVAELPSSPSTSTGCRSGSSRSRIAVFGVPVPASGPHPFQWSGGRGRDGPEEPTMLRYVVRRLLLMGVTVIGLVTVVFFLLRAIPGDPATYMLGDYATEESVAALKQQLGLDRPVYEQYVGFVARALTGDLGNSVVTGQPAFGEVLSSLPWSAALAVSGIVIAVLAGVPLGVISAVRQGTFADLFVMLGALVGISFPVFWVGLVCILLLAHEVRLFPALGASSSGGPAHPAPSPRPPGARARLLGGRVHRAPHPAPPCSRCWARITCGWPARWGFRRGGSCTGSRCETRSSRCSR